jgi:hypothetical protein
LIDGSGKVTGNIIGRLLFGLFSNTSHPDQQLFVVGEGIIVTVGIGLGVKVLPLVKWRSRRDYSRTRHRVLYTNPADYILPNK